MWERRAERERERDRVNSVRTIVLPCGKATKEKCERAHQREGVMEEREGWRGKREREKGCKRGCKRVRMMSRFEMVVSQLVQLLLCKQR